MRFFDKMRAQKVLSFTLVMFTLCLGIVIGTMINQGVKAAKDDHAIAPGASPLVIPSPMELSNSFAQIAKQVTPSVVNITTGYAPKVTSNSRGRRQMMPAPDQDDNGGGGGADDFIQRFFGGGGGGGFGGMMPEMRRGSATGSGVVVDRAGYILTNNHVVDGADRITVRFHDDPTEYPAKVIGTDGPTDLAVVRVEGKRDLVPAKIGNSDAVQVGDWAVAIGSPFEYEATVTAGIISAKGRDVERSSASQFQHFLQTDAAINPGNSGGPLLNIRGELIGINTAIASRSGGFQGIGFALPINEAARVYNDIIKNGKVTRGSIGIQFTPSDTARAQANLKVAGVKEGVFVEKVTPGGPSSKAGMKEGDVITGINGQPIHDGNQLIGIVSTTPVGSTLDLIVNREGGKHDLKVTVGDLAQLFPEQFGNRNDRAGSGEATSVSFGMDIQPLTERQIDNLGLKQLKGGVQIVKVEPDSFAEDIGLATNDVIVSINRQPVNTVDDVQHLRSAMKPGDAVQFKVLRKGQGRNAEWTSAFVAGTLPMR
jgi:serine protease Do